MAQFGSAHAAVAVPVNQLLQLEVFLMGIVDEGHLVTLGQVTINNGFVYAFFFVEQRR